MTKRKIITERLKNMSEWNIDDFIFYGDFLDGAFILNIEFDPKKPEIGWALFQQKLVEAKQELEATGDVAAFKTIDSINELVQTKWQAQNN